MRSELCSAFLSVEEFGMESDPLIVMLHGGPSLFGYMHTLSEALRPCWSVLTYAQRGTIANPSVLENITIEGHFEDLDGLIAQHKQGRPVILIGHSWGADLALIYAANRPRAIEKLILISTAPLSWKLEIAMEKRLHQRLSAEVLARSQKLAGQMERLLESPMSARRELNALAAARLKLTLSAYHYDPVVTDKVPELELDFLGFLQSKSALWELIESGQIPALLQEIDSPVFAIHGEDDVFDCEQTFAFLTQHISNLSTVQVKKCGHFPWLEPAARAEFLRALESALTE